MTVEALAEAYRDYATERDRQRLPKLHDLSRMIRGYEVGEHVPGPRYRMLYAAAFDMGEGRQAVRGSPPGRASASRAPSEVLAELLPAGDLSGRIATLGSHGGRAGNIEDLSARVHALRLADDVLAGGDLLAPAFHTDTDQGPLAIIASGP